MASETSLKKVGFFWRVCVWCFVFTYQTLALLAVLHPRVAAAVGEQAVLVEALAAQAGVALGAAEQVGVGVVAVAHHPTAHHLASLVRGEQLNIERTRAHARRDQTGKEQSHLPDGVIKHGCV